MIEIYPGNFQKNIRYGISHAISLMEEIHYNDVGKMTLVVDASDYNINAVKIGNVVYDTDMGTTFVIVKTKIQTENNRITANGYTADYLLNRRVAVGEKRQVKNIEQGVYTVVNENLRGLGRIKTAPVKGLPETYQGDDQTTQDVDESVVYGGQLLDAIKPVLEYGELGRRMVWDGAALEWTFEIYKGQDRTSGIHAVVFSSEQGSAADLVIDEDDSEFYTMAFVRWQWEGVARVDIVGTTWSEDARELWVESSVSVTVEKDEDYQTTKNKAIAEAMDKLNEKNRRKSFTVTVPAEEFGRSYYLGDIVSCVSLKYGVVFKARVTGYKYKLDARKSKFEVVLGEPEMSVLEVLKNGKY